MEVEIKYPFGVISDIHCNDWSAFSYTVPVSNINNRLMHTLDAIWEAADRVHYSGGNTLIVTGDLFHKRGKLSPSVLNPVLDCFQSIVDKFDLNIIMIPGNHDLEGKHSRQISNSVYALSKIKNITVLDAPTRIGDFYFIPWIEYKDDFIEIINGISEPEKTTVFCHIGIDGVLDDVKGKIGKSVLERGFKNVFSGDYHNHKSLGNGIYSVGALTHHSFQDVGSVAGYLLVDKDSTVLHYETKAPKFVEHTDKSIQHNYVRIKGVELSLKEAEELKSKLLLAGALAVQDLSTRPSLTVSSSKKTVDIDIDYRISIKSYCQSEFGENWEKVYEAAINL